MKVEYIDKIRNMSRIGINQAKKLSVNEAKRAIEEAASKGRTGANIHVKLFTYPEHHDYVLGVLRDEGFEVNWSQVNWTSDQSRDYILQN